MALSDLFKRSKQSTTGETDQPMSAEALAKSMTTTKEIAAARTYVASTGSVRGKYSKSGYTSIEDPYTETWPASYGTFLSGERYPPNLTPTKVYAFDNNVFYLYDTGDYPPYYIIDGRVFSTENVETEGFMTRRIEIDLDKIARRLHENSTT